MQGPLLLPPPLLESNLLLAMFHIGLSLVRDSYFFFVKYHIGPTSECAQQWMPGPGGGIMESPPPTPAIHDLLPSSQFSLSPQQFSRNIYSRINKHKYSKPDAIGTRTVIRDYRNVSTETFRSQEKMLTVANFFRGSTVLFTFHI